MKPADVLAFSSPNLTSHFIALASFGLALSHVGIVAEIDSRLMLVEATIEHGVRAVPISKAIDRHVGKVWHYPASRKLFKHEQHRLSNFLTAQLGKPYDWTTVARAGGYLVAKAKAQATRRDYSTWFCSELTSACYSEIGLLPTQNPARWSPNSFVRAGQRAGVLMPAQRIK